MERDTIVDLLNRFKEHEGETSGRLEATIRVIQGESITLGKALEIKQSRQKVADLSLPPPIWLLSPLSEWDEPTYAKFLVSFITSFYNPHVSFEDYGTTEAGSETPDYKPSDAEVLRSQTEFGRLLQFLHSESPAIGVHFDELWQHGDKPDVAWRTAKPYNLYRRFIDTWATVLRQLDEKGNSEEGFPMIAECIMNLNVPLLQKGLGVPLVMAEMVLHYSVVRKNYTENIIAERKGIAKAAKKSTKAGKSAKK